MKCKKYQLKNGLDVLFIESHKSPVLSIQMWVRTGSADESRAEAGISHFIEHLVFKGTTSFKVGEIASSVEGSGGELNAYTSFDQTVFYVTISKTADDVGLKVISEMMGFPTFDSTEIDNEREVVIEEIKRGQDSPGRRASQLLFSTAFKKHPYRIPVIGFDSVVKKVSRKKIIEYFQSRYVPSNMFLVVAGDFESKTMKKKVDHFFGKYTPYKLKKKSRPKEPNQKTTYIKTEKSEFKENFSYIAFKAPGASHKDTPALDLLALILGQGDSSRLTRKLRVEKPLANGIDCSSFTPNDAGFFCISFTFKFENLNELLNGILEELKKVLCEPISSEELHKAKINFESEQYYSLESVDSLARRFGNVEFLFRDVGYFEKFLKQIAAITVEDIQKVAKKYLIPEKLILTGLGEQEIGIKKSLTQFSKNYKKMYKSAVSQKSKAPLKAVLKPKNYWKNLKLETQNKIITEKIELRSGATLLLREIKETPIVNARAAFLGGLRAEPINRTTIAELFARIWTSGTSKRTEQQIHEFYDARAASCSAFSGRNSVGLNLDCLSPFEKECGDVWAEIISTSLFNKEALEREKTIILNQIKNRKDNPFHLAMMAIQKRLFAGHPNSKDLLGTEETASLVERNDITNYFSNISTKKNLTVCVCGHIDRNYWINTVNKIAEGLPSGPKFDKSFQLPEYKGNIIDRASLKREQSHVIIAFPGLTIYDKNRYALDIVQSVLSGQGGRLFLELRDKNSLAYSVSPIRLEGIEAGYFGGYIGCSPDKVDKAISMFKLEFKKLVDQKISVAELTSAKRYLSGRHDIDLQRTSTVNSMILFDDIYGLDYNNAFNYTEKISRVTADEVQDLCHKILTQDPIISIVGP